MRRGQRILDPTPTIYNETHMNPIKLAVPLLVALAYCPSDGWALPVLGSQLSSFAVLGASAVTNTGATTLTGNLGVSNNSSATGITGFFGTLANDGPGTVTGAVHQGDAFAISADGQLVNAMTSLGLMGAGTSLGSALGGLTLAPGIYSVSAGVSNLTGTLTLDGGGNANAFWVFQMPSTLITSSGSFVNVINTGAGAGVYWNVGSSATLGAGTSFEGNILASTSVGMKAGVTLSCGRALAHTGAVTLIGDTVNSTNCTGTAALGSQGLSGGLTILDNGRVAALPFAPVPAVPEPGTYALMLAGLGAMSFVARRNTRRGAA